MGLGPRARPAPAPAGELQWACGALVACRARATSLELRVVPCTADGAEGAGAKVGLGRGGVQDYDHVKVSVARSTVVEYGGDAAKGFVPKKRRVDAARVTDLRVLIGGTAYEGLGWAVVPRPPASTPAVVSFTYEAGRGRAVCVVEHAVVGVETAPRCAVM